MVHFSKHKTVSNLLAVLYSQFLRFYPFRSSHCASGKAVLRPLFSGSPLRPGSAF
ncbi:hypothetical protein HMPREF1548_04952 [Clostridium sp. KLE 1755]|nr:hypothetical protein HMPREF1548_04952 [Clostridium sp. KLE 1755]